jgi:hypothetical protein
MPFKSHAQMRKFFAMESRGELPKGKAEQWAKETPNIKALPERIGKKKTTGKSGWK